MHNAKALATYAVTKTLAVNLMYNHIWLASPCDAAYNSAGRPIARSTTCSAGRNVGQGTDLFMTYRYKHLQFGAGGGYFFPGSFLKRTTPGAGPSYLYVFHQYSL
jgi:hypothetical protein